MNISASPVKGAILVPFIVLIAIGGPWASSASVIPRVPAWNVTAPEGTDLTIYSTDQSCRVQICRVNKRINGPIRIERKIRESYLNSGSLSFEVQSLPSRPIQAEIYQHHAPWPVLSERRLIPGEPGTHRITWPVEQNLVEKDAAVVFNVEALVGTVEIKDVGANGNEMNSRNLPR